MKYFLKILILILLSSCKLNYVTSTKVTKAVEIICPGGFRNLLLGVDKADLRRAYRVNFDYRKTPTAALRKRGWDRSIVIVPHVNSTSIDNCSIREISQVVVPSSMGYQRFKPKGS